MLIANPRQKALPGLYSITPRMDTKGKANRFKGFIHRHRDSVAEFPARRECVLLVPVGWPDHAPTDSETRRQLYANRGYRTELGSFSDR
jgi:hypothetical protein